jgi:hypothetical protein
MEKSKQKEDFVWRESINKPVYTADGKEIGFVTSIQSDKIIVTSGPVSPDRFLIPKSVVRSLENGTIHLKEDSTLISSRYQFE